MIFLNNMNNNSLTITELNASIAAGIDYLFRHIRKDGSFEYKFNPETFQKYRSYNILRHAGTLYSIYQWKNISGDCLTENNSMDRSLSFLIGQCRFLNDEKSDASYIIERGKRN